MIWEIGKYFNYNKTAGILSRASLLRRIDDLEKSISDLMTQAGVEGHQQMADK